MKTLKFTIPIWLYLALLGLTWANAAPYYFLLLAAMSVVELRLGEFSETELRRELKFYYANPLMRRVKIMSALCFVGCNATMLYLVYIQNPQGWYLTALLLAAAYNNGTFLLSLAHEFSHAHSAIKRRLGDLLLFVPGLPFFRADHIFGHHEQVGTVQDKGSARLNQSFYSFLIKSFCQRIRRAYSLNNDLPREVKIPTLRHNYFFTLLLVGFGAGLYYLQPLLLWFWLGQIVLVYTLYELTNFCQHYGLRRLPGTAIGMCHSWNSYYKYSNYVTFFLLIHSPHHVEQPLHKIDSLLGPRMPYPVYQMLLLALIPRLWFRVMNPLVAKAQPGRPRNQKTAIPKPSVAGIPLSKSYNIYDPSI